LASGGVTYISACALLQWANLTAGFIVVWLAGALSTLTVLLTQVLTTFPTGGCPQVFGRVCAVKLVQILFTLGFTSLAYRRRTATQLRRPLQASVLARKSSNNCGVLAFDLTVEFRATAIGISFGFGITLFQVLGIA
jgi:hypothetical protein